MANKTIDLVNYGGAIKALDDSGRVGGYAVKFGNVDLAKERFTKDTDFVIKPTAEIAIHYGHGQDPTLKNVIFNWEVPTKDEVGLWVETQLDLNDKWQKAVYGLVKVGKMGWSTGAVAHTVDYDEPDAEGIRNIKRWHLAESSLVPNPCEPTNAVVTLKSFVEETEIATKSLFTEKLANYTKPYVWDALDAFSSTFYQILNLQNAAEGTDVTIEGNALARQAVADLATTLYGIVDDYFSKDSTQSFKSSNGKLRVRMPFELHIKAARDAEQDGMERVLDFFAKKESWGKKENAYEKHGAIIDELITDKENALNQLKELKKADESISESETDEELELSIEFEKLKFARLRGN